MYDNLFMLIGKEVALASFGVLATLSIGAIIQGYRRRALERKYPIAGEYISTYEDIEEGRKVVIKAPVKLKQKGRNVYGSTEFDGRTWILKGEIAGDGYLYGIYHAESLHDKGVGNFFLEVGLNCDMDGLWSGYDSINKIIQSGRYTFVRKLDFKIDPIEKRHVPAVLQIAEKQLGQAYIDTNDLLAPGNIAIRAYVDGKNIGFCTGKVISKQDAYAKVPQLAELNLKQLELVDTVGLVASVATDPKFTGRGVGSALVSHCIQELARRDIDVFMMTGWKSSRGVHIGSIAENHGFEKVLEVREFWKEDSVRHGYECPACGRPPCLCSAIVYIRHPHG